MGSPADIAREQEEGLALLFQRGLELALKIQDDAMAAETADERAKLAAAFHRISRSVRQTAALRAKLAADARRAEREAAAEGVRLAKARVTRRKEQLRAGLQRLIWQEAEDEESREDFKADLEELLETEALDDDFLSEPLAVQVERIREALGIDPPLQGEVSPQATEGVRRGRRSRAIDPGDRWQQRTPGAQATGRAAADSQPPLPSGPPHPLRGSSPSGGASSTRDGLLDDDYWQSSA